METNPGKEVKKMKKLLAVLFLGLTLGLNVIPAAASDGGEKVSPTVVFDLDQY